MTSILKVQLFRLKKSKLFWILMAVIAGLTLLSALLLLAMEAIFSEAAGGSFLEVLGMGYSATSVLSGFAGYSSDSAIFALVCSAVFLSREFTQGTMRNAVLANKNRKQLFFAYYIMALVIGTIYFVEEFVLTLGIHGLLLGFGAESAGQVATNVFIYFALGLCSVLFVETCVSMFLFCTRRQSLTIVLPLLVCLIAPSVVSSVISTVLNGMLVSGKQVSDAVHYCLPFYNLSMLNTINPDGLNVGMIALYDLLFSAVFFVSGYFPFQKADLK